MEEKDNLQLPENAFRELKDGEDVYKRQGYSTASPSPWYQSFWAASSASSCSTSIIIHYSAYWQVPTPTLLPWELYYHQALLLLSFIFNRATLLPWASKGQLLMVYCSKLWANTPSRAMKRLNKTLRHPTCACWRCFWLLNKLKVNPFVYRSNRLNRLIKVIFL